MHLVIEQQVGGDAVHMLRQVLLQVRVHVLLPHLL